MRAMILAAGRGVRLRPLTDNLPKPLLAVGGKALIVHHLERLARAGFREVVINHAHLGQMLEEQLGDGSRFGLHIRWSAEPAGALETAGGIAQALPLLGDASFLVINGDVYCDWDLAAAPGLAAQMEQRGDLAHLLLVPNPPQHPGGDFFLSGGRLSAETVTVEPAERLTFAGIGIYQPSLFSALIPGQPAKLAPLLIAAMTAGRISGERYAGCWHDIGTVDRLRALDAELGRRL